MSFLRNLFGKKTESSKPASPSLAKTLLAVLIGASDSVPSQAECNAILGSIPEVSGQQGFTVRPFSGGTLPDRNNPREQGQFAAVMVRINFPQFMNEEITYQMKGDKFVIAIFKKNLFGNKSSPEERQREGIRLAELGAEDYNNSKLHEAIAHYEQSLAILDEVGDRRTACAVMGNLGAAYADLGNTAKAVECHKKALETARQIGDKSVESNALRNLGLAYAKLGEFAKAFEYHHQEFNLAAELLDSEAGGRASFNASLVLDKLGKRAEAIWFAETSLKLYQLTNSPYTQGVQSQLNRWRESPSSALRTLLSVFINTAGRTLSESEVNEILDNDPDTKGPRNYRVQTHRWSELPPRNDAIGTQNLVITLGLTTRQSIWN